MKYYQDELCNHLEEIDKSFEVGWKMFYDEFKRLIPTKKTSKTFPQIIRVSKSEYHLPCSVCGKISVKYKLDKGRFDKKKALIFTGITHSRSLRKEHSSQLFQILDDKNLLGVHQFMLEYHSLEGLDAYCPDCDKIYCWEHYNVREEYDDGFYDCSCAVCPNGHQRMIDD